MRPDTLDSRRSANPTHRRTLRIEGLVLPPARYGVPSRKNGQVRASSPRKARADKSTLTPNARLHPAAGVMLPPPERLRRPCQYGPVQEIPTVGDRCRAQERAASAEITR